MENLPVIDYLLVHLNGKVRFNIEGIAITLMDGTFDKYPCLSGGRFSMMAKGLTHPRSAFGQSYYINGKRYVVTHAYTTGFLYHALGEILTHGTEEDGGWFSNTWTNPRLGTPEKPYIGTVDTIFYDEFIFLVAEGLLEFEDAEFLTEARIWANAQKYFDEKNGTYDTRLEPMYAAKTKEELRKAFRKLILEHHPDRAVIEDTAFARIIITTHENLKKSFA